MYTDLSGINNTYGDNLGGLMYFEFIPRQWAASRIIPDPVTNIVTTPVQLIEDVAWLKAVCLNDTLDFNEPQKDSDAGSYFEPLLTGTILKDDVSKNNITNMLRYHELIVIYTHRNGEKKIIGNIDFGMRFNATLSAGMEAKDASKFVFALTMQLSQRSPFYQI